MRRIKSPMLFYNGLLGRDWTLEQLNYPIIATMKYQGVFVMMDDGEVWTRHRTDGVRKVDNEIIRSRALSVLKNGMNAELCVNGWAERQVSGLLHAKDGREIPFLNFYVFDWMQGNLRYQYCKRLEQLEFVMPYTVDKAAASMVNRELCCTPKEVLAYHKKSKDMGCEGLVLRSLMGEYKCGRSTLKEATAFKIIDVETREAEIHSFTPNTSDVNRVGAILALDAKFGLITIGTGFSVDESKSFKWSSESFIGRKIYYQFRPHGMKDKPRQPVFAGFV